MSGKNKLPIRKHPRLKDFDYSSEGAYFITICTHERRCVFSRIVGQGLAPAEEHRVEYTQFGKIAERQLLSLEKRYPYIKIDKYVIMPNHIHAIFVLGEKAAGEELRPTIIQESDLNGNVMAAGASPRPTIIQEGDLNGNVIAAGAELRPTIIHQSDPNGSVITAGASPRPTIIQEGDLNGSVTAAGASPRPTIIQEGDINGSVIAAGAELRPTIIDIVCAYKSLTAIDCNKNGFKGEKLFQSSFYEHVIRNEQEYYEILEYIYENPMKWQFDKLFSEEY